MGFWDEHEAKARPPELPGWAPTPGTCQECGHEGPDVLFGSCEGCFAAWLGRR